jgi:hypothetical protein
MRKKIRPVYAAVGIVGILVGALSSWSVEAFAGLTHRPTFAITSVVSGANFAIPKNSRATWTLNLWSRGHLLASQTGTSGSLSLEIPRSSCPYQADVRKTEPNGQVSYFEAGARSTSSCCAA